MISGMWRQRLYGIRSGFTIVEILLVIVIIAVLAGVTLVSYQGATQRANNASIVSAAEQARDAIQLYAAENGNYPYVDNSETFKRHCITFDTGCAYDGTVFTTNSTFMANMANADRLPTKVPKSGRFYGIVYQYHSLFTFNGVSQPARLFYFLFGVNQPCGLEGVTTNEIPGVTSTVGYTPDPSAQADGKTYCYINIPGPPHHM